jgi:hypothetical protein
MEDEGDEDRLRDGMLGSGSSDNLEISQAGVSGLSGACAGSGHH